MRKYLRTDLGNAKLFVEIYGNEIRFNYSKKIWEYYNFEDEQWKDDTIGMAENLAIEFIESLLPDTQNERTLPARNWAIDCQSGKHLYYLMEFAKPLSARQYDKKIVEKC